MLNPTLESSHFGAERIPLGFITCQRPHEVATGGLLRINTVTTSARFKVTTIFDTPSSPKLKTIPPPPLMQVSSPGILQEALSLVK